MKPFVEVKCLLCRDNSHTEVKYPRNFELSQINHQQFSARRTTDRFHYQLLHCRTCGSVFSSPILPQGALLALYQQATTNFQSELKNVAASYAWNLEKQLRPMPPQRAALDIGCGSGNLLQEFLNMGFHKVAGVEPSYKVVAEAGHLQSAIFTGSFEDFNADGQQFDLITCFQTLDHLVDPYTIVQKVKSLLTKEGKAVFIVHNQQSIQAKLLGEKSPIYDIAHIYLFNKTTLRFLMEKAGMVVHQVFDVRNNYTLGYWILLSPLPFKQRIYSILKKIKLVNLKLPIYPGNIGIIVSRT